MCDKKTIRIILTEDGGQLTNWPVPPTEKIVEDFVAGYAGQGVDVLSYSLQGGHMAAYDSNVNGEVIPRTERGGRKHYQVQPTAKENVSRIEVPLSHLKLVRGKNLIGMTLDSKRPRGQAGVMVTEVEFLVERLTP